MLRGELVSILKSTSVVGYIAVQDLTKMSDITYGGEPYDVLAKGDPISISIVKKLAAECSYDRDEENHVKVVFRGGQYGKTKE